MSSLLSQQVNETFRDALLAFYLYTFDPLKTDKASIESAPAPPLKIYTTIGCWMFKSVRGS